MFRLSFEFQDREEADLAYVNAALSALRLSEVSLEDDSSGCLVIRTDYDTETGLEKRTSFRYVYDRLSLSCEPGDEDDDLFTWQIDAQAFPKGTVAGAEIYHDMWCIEHEDRVMRSLSQYTFDRADVFVVLHHEKAL